MVRIATPVRVPMKLPSAHVMRGGWEFNADMFMKVLESTAVQVSNFSDTGRVGSWVITRLL